MVESKEIAVLFKRKQTKNGTLELIPYKVIEGNYCQNDDWFVDNKNIGYHHITSHMETGICYGMRTKIDESIKNYLKEIKSNTEEPLKEEEQKILLSSIKKKILSFAQKYTYTKNIEIIGNISVIDKKTKKTMPYEDIDTIISEEKYNKLASLIKNNHKNQIKEEQTLTSTQDGLRVKMSPYELSEKIKETVKGQDEQIDTIVINLYLSLNYKQINKKGIILVGPSGTGKTLILKTISEILDIPVTIFSSAGLSQSGYIGRKTEDILSEIIINSNFDLEKAQNSIVFLDEIDKLAESGHKSNVATSAVQNELLRIIEGDKRTVTINNKTYQIDTTNIYFCAGGAFSQIYEDKLSEDRPALGFNTSNKQKKDKFKITTDTLSKYGMKKELLGRLPIIVELNDLDRETLKEILFSKKGELVKIIDLLKTLGINCPNIYSLADFIIDDAINKKIGARGLTATINKIFSKILFKIFSDPEKYSEIYFNEDILTNPNDYILVERQTKKLKRNIQKI